MSIETKEKNVNAGSFGNEHRAFFSNVFYNQQAWFFFFIIKVTTFFGGNQGVWTTISDLKISIYKGKFVIIAFNQGRFRNMFLILLKGKIYFQKIE